MEKENGQKALRAIKERLNNLRAQRKHIPNAHKPVFPFATSIDLLNKITSEEDYLLREGAKLKERQPLHSTDKGKSSYSQEVDTMFYAE